MFKVKALNQSTNSVNKANDENNIYLPQGYSTEQLDDIAIFTNNAYGLIFGVKRCEASKSKKLISIVRITNPKNNVSIRRCYKRIPFNGLGDNDIALSPSSIRLLCEENNADVVGAELELRRGTLWDSLIYYWEHPFHATRISFKIGLPALIISIISLILGIVALA